MKINILRINKKRNKAFLFLSSFVVLLAGSIYVFNAIKPSLSEASWWNDAWSYRQSIAITAHSALENNVYISTTISDTDDLVTAGKMQSDCGDLRFTKENGDVLPYYISSGCNTASTVVHVYFDTFPAGAQTIYMYYGNPSAQNGFSGSDFATEATSYTVGSYSSEQKTISPVAYWKFDEGTGTTASDSTQNKNNGTINGATWQDQGQCLSGKCLYLDGSNDYILVPDSPSLDVDRDGTWETWIRTDNVHESSRGSLIFKHYSNEYEIIIESNGSVSVYHGDGSFEEIQEPTDAIVPNNKWTHIAVTRNHSTNTYSWYINGKLVGTDTYTKTPLASSNPLYIGGRSGTSNNFKGFIDEMKIYNYTKDADQVKADYNARGGSENSAVLGATDNSTLSDGLTLYNKMDESSWTNDCSTATVTDSSGNGYNGASCPNTTGPTGGSTGKYSRGGLLDGSDDYLTVANTSNRILPDSSTNAFTVSTWVNANDLTSTTSDWLSIATNEVYSTSGFRLGTKVSKAAFWSNQSGGTFAITGSTTLVTGSWYLITATYDGTTARLYVNGKLDGSSTGTFVSGTQALQVGKIGGVDTWDGYMDEFRVYKRALSGNEVSQLYNWAPGPVAYYDFEEGQGSSLQDLSGNANTGTWSGSGTRYGQGKYGKGGVFNGTNDYIRVNTGTILNAATEYTIEFWINMDPQSSSFRRVMEGTGGSNPRLFFESNGTTGLYGRLGGTADTWVTNNGGQTNLTGGWKHVAITVNASGSQNAFVNGALVRTATLTSHSSLTLSDLYIGSAGGGSSYFLNGKLDELKIYNYARTPSQIVSDMNAGHPNVGSPVASAVGHWKFDEGYGTTTNNSGSRGSAMVATLNNMASPATTNSGWQQAGKIGKALAFDGNNDFVSLTDSATLGGGITISTWYKTSSILGTYNTLFNRGSQGSANGFVWFFFDTGTNALWYQQGNASYCSVKSNANSWSSDGKWHHLVASHDSSTNYITFYKDGQNIGGGSCTWANITNTGEYIGTYNNSSSTTYTVSGFMDEVKLYNYALSASDVKTDYNQGKSLVLGALSDTSGLTGGSVASNSAGAEFCIPGDTATCSAPVGYWNFEEGQGITANDTSGNGNVGSFTTGSAPFWAKGKIGTAGVFDGSATRLAITNTSGLTPTTLSQVAWVYPKSFPSGASIYNWRNGSNVGGVTAELNGTSGNLTCYYYISGGWRSATLSGSYALTQNEWNHIACTYDGTTIRAYKNGKLGASTTYAGSINNPSSPSFMIGKNVQANSWWNGYIDDVRVYDYGRTPAQVAWEYSQGKPVAHYKLDECQGTVAYDASGNGNNGTISIGGSGTQTTVGTCQTAGTAWGNGATGKYNASLNFDRTGTDDSISGNLSGSPVPITTRMTVSYWIKPSVLSAQQNHIFLGAIAGARIVPYMSSGNEFRCYTSAGSIASGFTLTSGAWYNLACVYDGTTLRAYVNGKEYASGPITLVLTTNDFSIGSSDTTYYTSGQIDDVRFYNYALTNAQMKLVHNQGSAVRFGPLTGNP